MMANSVSGERPRTAGKFIHVGDDKSLIRGVTYGTFRPNSNGEELPEPEIMQKDMRLMRELGANALRVYSLPPRRFLDKAGQNGLRVIVGIPWPQHVCFADQSRLTRAIAQNVRAAVQALKAHPAVLAVTIGNEIPAPVVRWHGRKKIERFLHNLYDAAKQADPEMLVTYVNYPPTEYLDLSFLDLCCLNVFLHRESDFRAYVARLQNISGNKPLILTEVGIDSLREGEEAQAEILRWQLRVAYELGASGACVFSWTDEWHRGGFPVEDWAFGLVDAQRRPKKAFAAVQTAFAQAPFPEQAPVGMADGGFAKSQTLDTDPSIPNPPPATRHPQSNGWPRVSVVVASHNAQSTLEDCLASLTKLQYPDFEVIVVDDGSTDETAAIARRFPFKLISIPKGGLSVARNIGLRAATGEVVAYTDSDCRVDPHWLSYLVLPFLNSDMVGVGGPNLVPPDDLWMAHCVARSPGGPMHVLLTDSIAEHIPGCNMAFRKWALEEIDGFDPAFVKAGDDVDVCWRLQERGYRLGFSHAALVWHHHRDRVRAYWRQQVGYGEGEAFLERKHPNKFNSFGHVHWQGSLYSPLPAYRALTTQRIYHGLWGGAAFPSVCHRPSGYLTHLPQSIEWQLTMMMIALYSVFNPWLLLMALTGFALTLGRCLAHAAATDLEACPPIAGVPRRLNRPLQRAVIAFLHFIQPLARIRGRLKGKLRSEPKRSASVPLSRELASLLRWGTIKAFFSEDVSMYWSTNAVEMQAFLSNLVHRLSGQSVAVTLDDGWQEWDLVARSRPFVEARIKAVSENHGGRKRLLRVATKLRIKRASWCAFMVLIAALVYLTRSNDGHRLGLELSLFWVSNLLALWYGARLLAKVSRASDEVAEGMTMTKFRERRTVSDPVAERSNIEHKTVR